jgi:hypothetical protein
MARGSFPGHRLWLVGLVLAPVVLVALGLALEPDPRGHGTHEQLGLPPCLLPARLGIPCPGCGWTTAVSLACHGRPVDAFLAQPLGPLTLLLALGGAAWAVRQHRRRRDLSTEVLFLRWDRWGPLLGLSIALSWAFEIVRWRGGAG